MFTPPGLSRPSHRSRHASRRRHRLPVAGLGSTPGLQPPIASNLRQPDSGSGKDPCRGLCSGWEPKRVKNTRLDGPADDNDGRGFVGFDQLDDDGIGCGDGTVGQFGNLDMEVSLPR